MKTNKNETTTNNTNVKVFAIKGTETFVLTTEDETNEDAYEVLNTKTGEFVKSYCGGARGVAIQIKGKSYCKHDMVWDNAPYFKKLEKEILASCKKVPGFSNYYVNLDTQMIWNAENRRFMKIEYSVKNNGVFQISLRKNKKNHRYTYAQLAYMSYHNEKIADDECVVSCNFNQRSEVGWEDVNDLIKIKKTQWGSIASLRNWYNKGNKTVDQFFDAIDALDLEQTTKDKLLNAILNKYC